MPKLFKVKKVNETPNQDSSELDKKVHICRRCGRVISDNESILLGMGPTCYHKYLCEKCQNKLKKLF